MYELSYNIREWILNPIVAAGLWLAMLGATMNNVVMAENCGMPVAGLTERQGMHVPMTPDTQLAFLGDYIDCEWLPGGGIASPGDLTIWTAIVVCVAGILDGIRRTSPCP